MKPITGNEVNRQGVYFTLTDTVDNYENVPKAPIMAPTPQKETSKEGYILDGKTPNTYTSPEGKNVIFAATKEGKVSVLKGGDLQEVLKSLTEKVGEEKAKQSIEGRIKAAITPQLTTPKKSIFTKTEKPVTEERKPATIKVTPMEEKMEFSIDDLDEETAF